MKHHPFGREFSPYVPHDAPRPMVERLSRAAGPVAFLSSFAAMVAAIMWSVL